MGNLSNLTELSLKINELSGPLPQNFTSLSLTEFRFNDTILCEPSNNAFQTWLSAIVVLERTGVFCPEIINDSLNLDDLNTAYDPADPRAPAGVFTVTTSFTNTSPDTILDAFFEVTILTNDNTVLNADEGEGGGGSIVSVGDVVSGETFDVVFEIGLSERAPFDFFVDAFGIP